MDYSFVVARDTQLLDKYYRLREACFREELGIPGFNGGEDDFDRAGTVLLAVERGGRVLAGARIYGNHPGQGRRLPVECSQFRLRNFFPTLDLANEAYCHWGRLVIDPDVRCKVFARSFLRRLLDCTETLGYRYAFIVTDRRRSRYYRQMHRSIGYDYRICNAEIPSSESDFGGLEHLVSYAVLPSGDSAVARDERWRHPGRLQWPGQVGEAGPLRLVESGSHA
ncbi:hypothetical protein [Parahaliea mediterranea]|uniref:Uncharacterized protein n=1 Tax=Parahaliea mediterranea TaxID=651086 RepID=A0A939DJJ2_9GAMM|nr:hypothetical protein [Parahaliea mediterranea]MBN7798682.1 hypothetical protein [Parahaliea mediterranea]